MLKIEKKLARKDFDIENKLGAVIGPVYQNLQCNVSARVCHSAAAGCELNSAGRGAALENKRDFLSRGKSETGDISLITHLNSGKLKMTGCCYRPACVYRCPHPVWAPANPDQA